MIVAPLNDPDLESHLSTLPPDGLEVFTLSAPPLPGAGGSGAGPEGGDLRGAVLHGSRLVAQLRANHGLGIMETLILGQAYLAAGLMASTLKDEDRILLNLSCEGPLKGLSVEGRARPLGGGARGVEVRGYLLEEALPITAPLESFDPSPFIGPGTLTVTRFNSGSPRPFTGAVRLKSGRLAEDLAHYYLASEQTRSAFVLGVSFDKEGRVAGAGGVFLQALPFAREDFVARAEAGLLGLPSLGPWFGAGKTSADLLDLAFWDSGLARLETREVRFSCNCSKDRFQAFVTGSRGDLLHDLAHHGPWPVVTTCHNCGSAYHFGQEELLALEAARQEGQP